MFQRLSGFFKKAPVPIIKVTPELLLKRETLCNDLQQIYETQLNLFANALPPDTVKNVPLIEHYTSLADEYKRHLSEIKNGNYISKEFTEELFVDLINKQLDYTVSELEIINSKIQHSDLKNLDEAYDKDIDRFFTDYHKNRISKSYLLKTYLYPDPLLTSQNSRLLLDEAIKTTSKMLSLNDYPIPKFNIMNSHSEVPSAYCISAHVVHIMFELFKNATIPSMVRNQPIQIGIYSDVNNPDLVVFEIKDNGGGMPNSMLKKIWQFHYTTSNDNDRDVIHGFGMGLPLCKVFAEFNYGSIKLVNIEDHGVTVYLKLPTHATNPEKPSEPALDLYE
ncbi:hypothetical protein CANINC_000235 [Pichia inconspicua]|uniref:Protein-serine/threonine kinase n=1 Tax=Pichia inconspicua TaxID=52247 RepID=A0A4T0X6R0_9ASCO|nr:hypothetical protein CANINC_000235 [[Candida] inconspicua]